MAPPHPPAAGEDPFERPAGLRRSRRGVGLLALAVTLTAGLVLALRPATGAPDAGPTPAATDPVAVLPVGDDRDTPTPGLGTWTPLPEAPLGPRWGAQAVWTGEEAIVWGGYARVPPDGDLSQDADPRTFPLGVLAELTPLRDGAALDPATGTWRAMALGPADIPAGAQAVWTGEELLVLGWQPGGQPGAWAYDPARDAWRTLLRGPLPVQEDAVFAWTGSEALVWSGDAPGEASAASALDLTTGRWRTTPGGPAIGLDPVGAWSGAELLVWDAASGVAYDPATDAWRPLDDPPAPMRPPGRVALTVGDVVLLAGAYPRMEVASYGYRYHPSAQRWDVQHLPEPPDEQFPAISASVMDGDHAVVLHRYGRGPSDGEAFRWTRASGTWERLRHDTMLERLATAEVWTGEQLIVWGGLQDGLRSGGAAWRP